MGSPPLRLFAFYTASVHSFGLAAHVLRKITDRLFAGMS